MNIKVNEYILNLDIYQLHFILMFVALALYSVMLKKKDSLSGQNVKLIRIEKDEERFTMYIIAFIVFVIMSLIFPNEFANISTATFNMITYISLLQADNLRNWGRTTENERYNNVINIIELLIIGGWGIRIVAEGILNHNMYVNISLIITIVVTSIWSLRQLKYIKNEYLSKS